jgi:hypothetical protein
MDQRSDVEYRAEKLYKNSREKFGYLLREVVSNSIHAVIIRKNLRPIGYYVPRVEFSVERRDDFFRILVRDNGDGFNELNRRYFTHLDSRNSEKQALKFHPKGQGRLAVVFFADQAKYTSIHADECGNFQRRSFDYPERSASLFDVDAFEGFPIEEQETGTSLVLEIYRHQTLGRAKTFFQKHGDIGRIKNWFIDNFFPFFMEEGDLELSIDIDGDKGVINKAFIEKNIEGVPFSVNFGSGSEEKKGFKVWLMPKLDNPRSKNQVTCFARHLRAELEFGKLIYEIDLNRAFDWLLTSEYFDDNVDQKGDKIEIEEEAVDRIQSALNWALDKHFAAQIEINRRETKKNIESTKTKFHSLSVFIEDSKVRQTNKVLRESEIITDAIEAKGRVEKSYWMAQGVDPEALGKLLNSSLHIYIDHRAKTLKRFQELIRRFDEDGADKNESEDEIHDLFLRRGETLRSSSDKNYFHNLWILDDKYTIFSETFKALSSKKGQEASDIYMWTDDPERARELLILELKSPSVAHNAGNKYESMVAQVKRYAAQFYREPSKVLNWEVAPEKILYTGIILARKSDINKELNSNNSGASPNKIPFLDSSYYFNERFSVGSVVTAAPIFKDIRIEMYSYEDIYQLAVSRNNTFFKLLKGEFRIDE